MRDENVQFLDPGELVDADLRLVLRERRSADPVRGYVPAYLFDMVRDGTGQVMGYISLRIGHSEYIERYAGHIGYRVEPLHRGRHYAERATRLLLPLAKAHGLRPLWITVTPDNLPSRRTCERLGCEMVEIVDLPPDTEMYAMGERQKCRYRLDL